MSSAKTPKVSAKTSKTFDSTKEHPDYENRIRAEMLDSFDEELEMEIDDDRMNELVKEATKSGDPRGLGS